MTPEQRADLNDGMELFLTALFGGRPGTLTVSERRLVELARQHSGEANRFVKRAAVLHSDAAITDRRAPRQPPRSSRPHGDPPSPLFPQGQLIEDDDGEFKGQRDPNWNWSFARSLLDLVTPRPAEDPFVAEWYHATTAYMFRQYAYGEATPHLDHAAAVLPDEPRILFDLACLSEVKGLPISQAVLTDQDLTALRFKNPGARPMGNGPRLSTMASMAGIPPLEVANAEAEKLFRQTLKVDPSFVEARVRLARLLILRKRYAEADRELTAALVAIPDPVVAYYAHLFAGRADRALDRLDAAEGHYRAALALYPEAQSALLGASQVALLRADVPGALAPVHRLAEIIVGHDRATDPWWRYRIGHGRNVDALLTHVWSAIALQK